MKRNIYNKLLNWKNSGRRKPLVLQGARQVGKTFIVNKFGKNEYGNYVHLNFERNKSLKLIFDKNLNANYLLDQIGIFIGEKIEVNNTLIFFDEIQESPEALKSLKYFHEEIPELHVIAAGSLLGVSVGTNQSFPVGKVNFIDMHPMNFSEFLIANNEDLLLESIKNYNLKEDFPESIHEKALDYLKLFLFTGGMPEVVDSYLKTKDISLVREIQNDILRAYKNDFSKYSSASLNIKISELWNSVPYQLSKENKKFKYNEVKKNSRSTYYEESIEWLKRAGLINMSYLLRDIKLPLNAYMDLNKFKIFMNDSGLLAAKLNLNSEIIIKPIKLFKEYNGAFIENFVSSELISNNHKELFYWKSRGEAEVDFIIENNSNIFPVEVKSGTNKSMKSLRSFQSKYNSKKLIRISPRNFHNSNDFINIPLYAISFIDNYIKP